MRPPAVRPSAPSGGDDAIRATDDDAALSRLSAVQSGYLEDPYAGLVYKLRLGERPKKAPLINVGTHHRTYALDKVIDSFTAGQEKVQIVSLGAGSDTRFWRMMVSGPEAARFVGKADSAEQETSIRDEVRRSRLPAPHCREGAADCAEPSPHRSSWTWSEAVHCRSRRGRAALDPVRSGTAGPTKYSVTGGGAGSLT